MSESNAPSPVFSDFKGAPVSESLSDLVDYLDAGLRDHDTERILGAFDPRHFFCGLNNVRLVYDENPLKYATVLFHEREHFYQTISTSFGFWLSHQQQTDKLITLRDLVNRIRQYGLTERISIPILEWRKRIRQHDLKCCLDLACLCYLMYERMERALSGSEQVDKEDPLFHVLGFQHFSPKNLSSPQSPDGEGIGYFHLMEGLAQVKTVLALMDYKNYISDDEIDNWRALMELERQRLKSNRRYGLILRLASELLQADLFDDETLFRYAPLLRTAGDFALMIPNHYNSVREWEEFHPGFRFVACILGGKDVEFGAENDAGIAEFYETVIRKVVREKGWCSPEVIVAYNYESEFSNQSFVDRSYLLSAFRTAFTQRLHQPHVFAWSDYYESALKRYIPLPFEYFHGLSRTRENLQRLIDTYILPWIIRPGVIRQLYECDQLVCPLRSETDAFPVELKVILPCTPVCDYKAFRDSRLARICAFRLLLKNIGLEAVDNRLLVI